MIRSFQKHKEAGPACRGARTVAAASLVTVVPNCKDDVADPSAYIQRATCLLRQGTR